MHVNAFDRYYATESPLHRLDARVKVLGLIAFVLSNALLPDGAWAAFGLTWLLLLLANLASHLGPDFTFRRSFIALPFMLVALSALFAPNGQPLAEWNLLGLSLTPTDTGLIRFGSILLRTWLSVQAGILLVAVTPFPDLIHAFEHLRVPAILTTIIAFLYRYLFVLSDEVLRLLRARDSRSAAIPGQKSGRSVFWRAQITGHMAGQLFLRSYERSDRIYHAMLARGYTGHIRTLRAHVMRRRDWLSLVLLIAALLVVQLIGRIG
ncbi:MAG: cobalt ECF transporter T component CbiQ [Anaerolineales bacterium]|nr:cobalt ECF transporter T component CbiQ [Anaerolineales bacterium]MDW8278483.1 cobalt ECF transporter T component CbiQ [Anaerolineales bacterium]